MASAVFSWFLHFAYHHRTVRLLIALTAESVSCGRFSLYCHFTSISFISCSSNIFFDVGGVTTSSFYIKLQTIVVSSCDAPLDIYTDAGVLYRGHQFSTPTPISAEESDDAGKLCCEVMKTFVRYYLFVWECWVVVVGVVVELCFLVLANILHSMNYHYHRPEYFEWRKFVVSIIEMFVVMVSVPCWSCCQETIINWWGKVPYVK